MTGNLEMTRLLLIKIKALTPQFISSLITETWGCDNRVGKLACDSRQTQISHIKY